MINDNIIEFEKGGIKYKGTIKWASGSSGAGFHIDMELPTSFRTKSVRYYSTDSGKSDNRSLEEICEEVILTSNNIK